MNKNMKKRKHIGLWIILVLLVILGALAFWQRENLKALYTAKTEDAETILQESQAKIETHQKELEKYDVVLNAPTQEEKEELLSGGEKSSEPKKTDVVEKTMPEEIPAVEQPTAQSILDRCVQELYDCEIDLMARLGTMKQAAVDEWCALPSSQQTTAKKLEIGQRGLTACYELEVEIDTKVKSILAKYRTELESIKADTAPLDTLWQYYCEEKASTKAYYLNKYL